MDGQEFQWGSAAWFNNLYLKQNRDSPASYFSYSKSGYQKFRHERLIFLVSSQKALFQSNVKLIDVGCATGYLTHKLCHAIKTRVITGIDFSSVLLMEAKNNYPYMNFLQGVLPKLPLKSGVANVVSMIEVLYYLREEERSKCIAECARLLCIGGILIFAANVQGRPYLMRNEVIELIANAGFEIVKTYDESYGWAIFIERTLKRVHRFCKNVSERSINSDLKNIMLGKVLSYLKNPAGRLIAKIGIVLIEGLIKCKSLYSFLSFLNRLLPGKITSHLVVLAQKI